MSAIDQYRRRFLKNSGAAIVATGFVSNVNLTSAAIRPVDQAVSTENRWGLSIDVGKCQTGCTECIDACNQEHGLRPLNGPETDAQWIRKADLKHKQTDNVLSLPVMCQHCSDAPCIDVCPTGASFRRDDGIVLVDKHICIGCRYCMMACPFQARNFIHEQLTDQLPHAPRGKGTVESCTLCVHKIDRGDNTTACAEACPEKAIVFGDLNDPQSKVSLQIKQQSSRELRPSLKLDTSVRYQGLESA